MCGLLEQNLLQYEHTFGTILTRTPARKLCLKGPVH